MAKGPQTPSSKSKTTTTATEARKSAWRGIAIKQKSSSRPNSTSRKSVGSISSSDSTQLFDDKSSGRDTIDTLPPPKLESVKEYSTPLTASNSSKTTRSRASSTTSDSLFQDANDGIMQNNSSNMNPVDTSNTTRTDIQNNNNYNSGDDDEEDDDDAFYYSNYFLADTQKSKSSKTKSKKKTKAKAKAVTITSPPPPQRITSLTYGGSSPVSSCQPQIQEKPIVESPLSYDNLAEKQLEVKEENKTPTRPTKNAKRQSQLDDVMTSDMLDMVAYVDSTNFVDTFEEPVDLATSYTKERDILIKGEEEEVPLPLSPMDGAGFISSTSSQQNPSTPSKPNETKDANSRNNDHSKEKKKDKMEEKKKKKKKEKKKEPPPPSKELSSPPPIPTTRHASIGSELFSTRVTEKDIEQHPAQPPPSIPLPSPPSPIISNMAEDPTPLPPTVDLQKDDIPPVNNNRSITTEVVYDEHFHQQRAKRQEEEQVKESGILTTPIATTTTTATLHDHSFVQDVNQRRDSVSTNSVSTVDSDDRIKFSEDRQSHSRFDFLPLAVEEDPADLDMLKDNEISIQTVDVRNIHANRLGPRDQEEADEHVREGMRLVFNNKFMRAKAIFQPHASTEPLYGVALGVIATIKAMMTQDETDMNKAISTLASAYTIAKTQIDAASIKRSLKDSLSQYFSSFMVNSSSNELASPVPAPTTITATGATNTTTFLSNGVLRAHVIKAECSLFMALLQLSRENVVDYLKCGLNLRRAHKSYNIVWQEYKRMGQEHTKRMDRDTVSGVQFGIGAINLLVSALPPKILKIFSSFGFTCDKELGLVLLKLCLEGKGIRSPLAAIILLSYYSVLTSLVPQLYSKELAGPAVECLLEAQKSFPSSCFFLYFAAKIARIAGNLPLSLQSFSFAMDASRSEMMEVAMRNVTLYETGWNHALQLDWESAARCFDDLAKEEYSSALCMYAVGACREMLGQRTQGILAFAEVPQHVKKEKEQQQQQQQQQQQPHSASYIESYVYKKVEHFQKSGYQDMDFNLPMLELMCIWNAFEQMEHGALEHCLEIVNSALDRIHERELRELSIRTQELAPSTSPPDYYHHRALILLIKASVLNALQRHGDSIPHLNWIMDNKDDLTSDAAAWIIPFAYWEAGVTSWGLRNYVKSRKLWQQGLACSKYDFEYRMAIRFNLALAKCNDIGIGPTEISTTEKILGMHAQKRAMSIQYPTST